MDARTQLRRYLEQRRELGEAEFVLDNMSVEEALQAIGVIRQGGGSRMGTPEVPRSPSPPVVAPAPPSTPAPVMPAPPGSSPSKSASGGPAPVMPGPSPAAAPVMRSDAHTEESDEMKKIKEGLVVGASEESLFTKNPFANLKSLDAIAKTVEECTRCALYKTATHAVPGEGNPKADLVCVGEAPGANEDATGRPFVGAAGQLLTKILAAIDLTREDVFICNVLKHRPPGNRNPKPDEITACSPYLIRQLELIRPKVILAFGTFASQTLLETKTSIGKLRGSVHQYHGIPLVVTYHPAALLRNPAWKRPTWEDVKLARRVLDHGTK